MPSPTDPPAASANGAIVRHGLRFIPLLGLVYSLSAGGGFGPEEIVPQSGPGLAILLVLLMPILYGLPLGLASGEMASRFPVEGGYYRWVRRIFGDFWGFQAGWSAWMGAFCDGAVYAGFAAAYFEELMKNVLPAEWVGTARFLFILVVIVFCTAINLRGIHIVGWSSVVFNLFVLSPFIVMGFVGLMQWTHNPLVPFKPPGQGMFTSLGAGMLIAMWCYSGYESLSTAAEEMEDPRRNYLKAILISMLVTIPFYLIPLVISLATSDWTTIDAGAYSAVAWSLGGAGLGTWVAASGMLGNINLFNAYTLAYSRVPFAMAQDGFMPMVMARTHPKYGTPWVSILIGALVYSVLTFTLPIHLLLVIEMWLYGLIYILIYLALWRIRCRPDLDTPVPAGTFRFTIPGGRWGIWLIIGPPMILILVAMFASGPEYILWGGPALLSGAVLYPFARRLRRRRAAAGTAAIAVCAAVLLMTGATPAAAQGAAASAPRFVGSAKCRACHFPEHKSWAATRMAKAFDLLKPGAAAEARKKAGLDPAKDYTADPKCLACHTTGYGKPGGFVSLAETPELAGVQCEACHGAGSEYLKPGKMTLSNREYKRSDLVAAGMILQSAANCAACHNEKSPTHKPLNYGEGVKTQVHTLVPLKFKHE